MILSDSITTSWQLQLRDSNRTALVLPQQPSSLVVMEVTALVLFQLFTGAQRRCAPFIRPIGESGIESSPLSLTPNTWYHFQTVFSNAEKTITFTVTSQS